MTPEEKVFRNALQQESTPGLPVPNTTSLQDGQNGTRQGPRNIQLPARDHEPYNVARTKGHFQATQVPSRLTQEISRLPDAAPAKASQVASNVESLEKNGDTRIHPNRPVTPPIPPSEPHIPQRPKFGGWAKHAISTDLDPDEKALRQALQKEAAPKPHLPVHPISHSPHTSSVPGYPSRPDIQARDARSEETARTAPIQTSSTQPYGTPVITNTSGLPRNRQARDAQLDHHISQTRGKPTFRQGDWYCPDCAAHNFSRQRECITCYSKRPSSSTWQCEGCGIINVDDRPICNGCQAQRFATTTQDQSEHVKHWKHLKRPGNDVAPNHSQPEQGSTQRGLVGTMARPRNTGAIARARAIEQEKMERMERTKGGEFIGLRGQYETATSKATEASYWSQETNESQVPDVKAANSSAPDEPKTGRRVVSWRPQSAKVSQMDGVQDIRDERSIQELPDKTSEDQPRAPKLTGGWKRWEPISAGEQPALEEPSQQRLADQTNRSGHLTSAELEREQNTGGFRRVIERRTRREPQEQGIAKQFVYDKTVPSAKDRFNDRDRIRRRKVVSTYDEMDEEEEDRAARRMERKEQRKKAKAIKKAAAPPTPIYLPEFISVSNLAGVLRLRVEDFIQKMKDLGFEETNNDHILDAETAGLVAAEFNFEPIFEEAENPDLLPIPPAEDKSVLPPRPPVVTIMGHVDHGKTTLLDYLRKSSVAASEHGGITQHIGAFSVPMPGGRLVTFLDTPGHEAFLTMRQRGANVTDIVILVVAADDSVKPQTVEAIRHAQTARVPMIVAVNKIDKEDSNAERVKQDLARYGVEIEDYGGDTQVVCVSGKTGQGMDELEDATVALADILDMRAETDGQAEGWVLEATTKRAGRVATVLVRRGTLRPGDIIVAGTSWAKVRSLRNEAGVILESAGPGTPVEIDGWREQPTAGDEVLQAPDEQRAKAAVDYRLEAYERTQMATDMAAVNEARRLEQEKRDELEKAAELAEKALDAPATATSTEMQSTSSTPSFQEVFFVVKADVSGSVEAVTDAVSALGNSEIRPHILRTGVGPVTEFDIDHAAVAKGHIISFNTTIDGNVRRTAEAKDVKILDQSIIYRLVDDVKAKLSEKLPDIVTQKVLGEAEIAQVFEINTKGRITVPFAGCRVRNGVISRNNKIRVLRGKETIYDGMHALLHDPCTCTFTHRLFY